MAMTLFALTISVLILVSSASASEGLIQASTCGYSSNYSVYGYGSGHSLYDFSSDETVTVQNVSNSSYTYYFDLCSVFMPAQCENASICRQILLPYLQFYKVASLMPSNITTEDDGITIYFTMDTIVNAICFRTISSPIVQQVDDSNDTLIFNYFTPSACEGQALQVQSVRIYISSSSEIIISFLVFINNSPVRSFDVDYYNLENSQTRFNISGGNNLQYCMTYNVSIATLTAMENQLTGIMYNVTAFQNQTFFFSHLQLLRTDNFETNYQCFLTITLQVFSRYVNFIVITQNKTRTPVNRTVSSSNSVFPQDVTITVLMTCNVHLQYEVIPYQRFSTPVFDFFRALNCTVSGNYYLESTLQTITSSTSPTSTAVPTTTNTADDDDDDGLSEADKIIIAAVVTFVGTAILISLMWMLCILVVKKLKKSKQVYVYPLKSKINKSNVIRKTKRSKDKKLLPKIV